MNKFKKLNPFQVLVALHLVILLVSIGFLIQQKGDPIKSKSKIVVIPINGVISMQSRNIGSGRSVDSLVKYLKKLRKDNSVKGIVLRVNSPGGSVGAVQEIYDALLKFKAEGKVIVSSFGDVSASGGYYISCAADAIVSQPGTITGSIGVVMQFPQLKGLLNKVGVSFETIKSGRFKDVGSPFRDITPRERQYVKDVIMDAYDQFYQAVKVGRNLDDKHLKNVADGRIFSGRMAHQKKLVDHLGGLEVAITKAKELAGISKKEPEIIYDKDESSIERLINMLSTSSLGSLSQLTDSEFKLMYILQ